MSAQKGKDILLKLGDEGQPIIYTTIGGIRTQNFSLAAEPIDITHAQSPGWRELLHSAGTRQLNVSGRGVFISGQTANTVQATFFTSKILSWQLVVPGLGIMEGPFLITGLDYAGEHNGEAEMTISLASAGAISFTGV
ncbi:MAG: phage major tail protein, TP901-1 family [bacterium]